MGTIYGCTMHSLCNIAVNGLTLLSLLLGKRLVMLQELVRILRHCHHSAGTFANDIESASVQDTRHTVRSYSHRHSMLCSQD